MSWFFGPTKSRRPDAIKEITLNRDTLQQRLDLTLAQGQAARSEAEMCARRGDRSSALLHLQLSKAKESEAAQIASLRARAEKNIAALQMHELTAMVVKDSQKAIANLTRDRKLTADAAADVSDLLEDVSEDNNEISSAIGVQITGSTKDELEEELDRMLSVQEPCAKETGAEPFFPRTVALPDPPHAEPASRSRKTQVVAWLEDE